MSYDLGRRLQLLRQRKRLKQNQVAELLGVGRSTISSYENGYSTPPQEILKAFASIYGVTTDYLLNYNQPEKLEEHEDTQVEQLDLLDGMEANLKAMQQQIDEMRDKILKS